MEEKKTEKAFKPYPIRLSDFFRYTYNTLDMVNGTYTGEPPKRYCATRECEKCEYGDQCLKLSNEEIENSEYAPMDMQLEHVKRLFKKSDVLIPVIFLTAFVQFLRIFKDDAKYLNLFLDFILNLDYLQPDDE